MPPSESVAKFRSRFAGVGEADRADDEASTAESRLAACLELHGLALWMDVERAMRDGGFDRPEDVVDEVNRRRLAASPMPPSLRDLWRARR